MPSQLKILGCSGGFGAGLRTTSFLWDDDILIDAGTGVGDLSLEELIKIDQIFLTHSHLDHIVSIAFMADAVGAKRSQPLKVYGLAQTLQALHQKIFHDHIWPDFTVIPSPEKPFIQFHEITPGQTVAIGSRQIQAIAVNHILPALGYLIRSDTGSLAFSGDTTTCPGLWKFLSEQPDLRHVIVEASFPNAELSLAKISKHYCPSLLLADLAGFSSSSQIHISHTKPGESAQIMQELVAGTKDGAGGPNLKFAALQQDQDLLF
jgi:ribonuclease BN (tRNA processing enzyme)